MLLFFKRIHSRCRCHCHCSMTSLALILAFIYFRSLTFNHARLIAIHKSLPNATLARIMGRPKALVLPSLRVPIAHDDYKNNNHDSSQQLHAKNENNDINRMEMELRNIANRYFVYEEPNDLVKPDLTEWFRSGTDNDQLRARFGAEAQQEDEVLMTLSNHPLRTKNQTLANLWIVPLRVGAGIIHKHDKDTFTSLAWALRNYTTIRDQPHVLVSLTTAAFNKYHQKHTNVVGMDRTFYQMVAPLIVAQSLAAHAAANISQIGAANGHDYEGMFLQLRRAMSQHGFSMGLLPQTELVYQEATYTKFRNAKNFIFYQTRVESSAYNSTRFRQILLDPSVLNQLLATTNSSIGYGLPPDDWLREYSSSQFCLAIRGDTPHTHALLNAVKVGCIPVVISDFYPLFAPSFPSTLNMEDYCVFIKEADFIRDPAKELLKLKDLGETWIRRKLDALAFAQKVVLMDHPESLFVPAFVKESMYAYQHPAPKSLFIKGAWIGIRNESSP